jgi:hypothetical protein
MTTRDVAITRGSKSSDLKTRSTVRSKSGAPRLPEPDPLLEYPGLAASRRPVLDVAALYHCISETITERISASSKRALADYRAFVAEILVGIDAYWMLADFVRIPHDPWRDGVKPEIPFRKLYNAVLRATSEAKIGVQVWLGPARAWRYAYVKYCERWYRDASRLSRKGLSTAKGSLLNSVNIEKVPPAIRAVVDLEFLLVPTNEQVAWKRRMLHWEHAFQSSIDAKGVWVSDLSTEQYARLRQAYVTGGAAAVGAAL